MEYANSKTVLNRYLAVSDVLISLSIYGEPPLSLLEGMQAGLLIVASKNGTHEGLISLECGVLLSKSENSSVLEKN